MRTMNMAANGIGKAGGRAKKFLLAAVTGVSVSLSAQVAFAQDSYPSKPIRLVIPFGAGGSSDIAARAMSERLTAQMKQSVIVDNRPGGGGQVGTMFAAKSDPDGYTFLWGGSGPMFLLPALDPKVPFNTSRDFSIAAMAIKVPLLLVASPSLGVKDFRGLRELLKNNPEKYSYGSAGAGSSSFVASAALLSMIDARKVTHIPYKSTGQALIDVMGGRLAFVVDIVGTTSEHIRAGRLTGMAVLQNERLPQLPDVPTMAEAGLPEYLKYTWSGLLGVYAPKGTPQVILERMNREVNQTFQSREFVAKLDELGMYPVRMNIAESQALMNNEVAAWVPLLKALGIDINSQ